MQATFEGTITRRARQWAVRPSGSTSRDCARDGRGRPAVAV